MLQRTLSLLDKEWTGQDQTLRRLVRRLMMMMASTGMEAMEVDLQDYKKGRESISDGN